MVVRCVYCGRPHEDLAPQWCSCRATTAVWTSSSSDTQVSPDACCWEGCDHLYTQPKNDHVDLYLQPQNDLSRLCLQRMGHDTNFLHLRTTCFGVYFLYLNEFWRLYLPLANDYWRLYSQLANDHWGLYLPLANDGRRLYLPLANDRRRLYLQLGE